MRIPAAPLGATGAASATPALSRGRRAVPTPERVWKHRLGEPRGSHQVEHRDAAHGVARLSHILITCRDLLA
jgi:hypothetical protein